MKSRKSWRDKIDKAQPPKVEPMDPRQSAKWGLPAASTLLIPSPQEVEQLILQIPAGQVVTTDVLREVMAVKHGATAACPLCTGIFCRIVSEASMEAELGGNAGPQAPWWRVLKSDGGLHEKFPGGGDEQARRLQAEGFTLVYGKGKKPPRVMDYAQFLAQLS